jgi:hypothetical protein
MRSSLLTEGSFGREPVMEDTKQNLERLLRFKLHCWP